MIIQPEGATTHQRGEEKKKLHTISRQNISCTETIN